MRKPMAVVAITGLTLALAACGAPGQRPAPVPPDAKTDPPTTVRQTIRESNTLQGDVPAAGSGARERGTTDVPTSAGLLPSVTARPGAPTAGSGPMQGRDRPVPAAP